MANDLERSQCETAAAGSPVVRMFVPLGPQRGDVLIARRTASVDYDVVVVFGGECSGGGRHDSAVAAGQAAAAQLHVDLWMTEDHIHFCKLASYRPASHRFA